MVKKALFAFLTFCLLLPAIALADTLTLESPQLTQGERMADAQVFSGFGCTGANISPKLIWKNAPAGTKSFAVTVYDPDAPTGSGWWHWVIFNIPAGTSELNENTGNPSLGLAPQGAVQSRTDFGKPGYGGACPPAGDKPHRYIFTLFTLDTPKLELGTDTPAAMVGFYLNRHTIAKTSITVLYDR